MKAVEHRGTSHGDQGKVAGTKLFDGHLFSSREPMFAEMVQYLNNLPHLAGKQVGFGVVLASPGAGKSFMLQRAYNVALAHDQCTLRLLFGYNHNMNTDAGALHHLASRVLFTYFCGYPSVQVDSILTRIGKLVDRLFRNAMTTDVVKQVIDLLEADFASHRSLEPSAVRTIFFVDEAREERVLVGQERTVQSDVRATLDNAVGRRGAIFTALQMYGPESKNHPLWWFAVEPLPVHNDDVFAAKVLNALGKFANVDSRLPVVMLALALTGGHARTVEVMIQLLNERATIADSDIVAVMGQVRARLTVEYGDRIPFVQRWFVASLLGANFRFGAVDQNYPLDAARAAGDVINASAATRRDDGLPTRVVPEVSLLRLGALVTGATGVAQLFKFLMMPDRLLASRTNAIVLEELVVASLSLKMGLIYNASTERPTTENERLWWPVPFIGASSDRVRLFSDGEALALLPCPRRTAPIVRAPAECAIYDEVSLGGRGETRIFHINESIWADEWSVYTATGEFDAFAYGFASTSSRWVVDAPVLVYSALSNRRRLTRCCFTRMRKVIRAR
jgi:hypothetical protein